MFVLLLQRSNMSQAYQRSAILLVKAVVGSINGECLDFLYKWHLHPCSMT